MEHSGAGHIDGGLAMRGKRLYDVAGHACNRLNQLLDYLEDPRP